jgi:hypothetical protein
MRILKMHRCTLMTAMMPKTACEVSQSSRNH